MTALTLVVMTLGTSCSVAWQLERDAGYDETMAHYLAESVRWLGVLAIWIIVVCDIWMGGI